MSCSPACTISECRWKRRRVVCLDVPLQFIGLEKGETVEQETRPLGSRTGGTCSPPLVDAPTTPISPNQHVLTVRNGRGWNPAPFGRQKDPPHLPQAGITEEFSSSRKGKQILKAGRNLQASPGLVRRAFRGERGAPAYRIVDFQSKLDLAVQLLEFLLDRGFCRQRKSFLKAGESMSLHRLPTPSPKQTHALVTYPSQFFVFYLFSSPPSFQGAPLTFSGLALLSKL